MSSLGLQLMSSIMNQGTLHDFSQVPKDFLKPTESEVYGFIEKHVIDYGVFPNFILIGLVLINLFSPFSWQKTSSAFLGGFFLDVFSLNDFGGCF